MWFEKRSKSVSETEKEPLEHWPTERMVLAGHAEVAMRDDLEGLSDEDLAKVAEICIVNEFAPDECIPCYAHTLYLDRQKNRLEEMAPELPEPEYLHETDADAEYPVDHPLRKMLTEGAPEDPEPFVLPDMKDRAESGESEADTSFPIGVNRRPYVDILWEQVRNLNLTLEEILNGPPIPPKDVSMAELALLVLAADKYVKMTDAQGVELSDNQQQVLDSTRNLVARLRS
jgi:hypothetical protein